MLGNHLAQHGTEQRIRVHLDYLLDLPSEGMFIDNGEPEDNESQDKNTILVRNSSFKRANHIVNTYFFAF